jgi:hypothetical protein
MPTLPNHTNTIPSKTQRLAHIQTDNTIFPHMETPLATIWLQKTINYPTITPKPKSKIPTPTTAIKLTTLEQITLPNRTSIMNEKNFNNTIIKSPPPLKKHLKSRHTYFAPQIVQ